MEKPDVGIISQAFKMSKCTKLIDLKQNSFQSSGRNSSPAKEN